MGNIHTEVGDAASHKCSSDYFNLLLAGRLSSSLIAQLNMSADGWKGFRCKEQRDGKKSPSWVAGWKFER